FREPDQLRWTLIRQLIEEHCLDHAEDGGVGADAEDEREDGDGGKGWLPRERPESVSEVAGQVAHGGRLYAALLPDVHELQVVGGDVLCRLIGRSRAAQERGRRLPEHRAADGETGRGGAVGRGREPAADGRDFRRLAEDDLAAGGVGGNRAVDGARALARERALDFPELRRQRAPIRFGDEAGEHRRPPDRLEVLLRLAAPRDQNLDDQRLAGGAAPGLQALELLPLPLANRLLIVGAVADEHLDEGARQRARERIGG